MERVPWEDPAVVLAYVFGGLLVVVSVALGLAAFTAVYRVLRRQP